ncbi:MAG: polymer-forming cytoskeletal protein [Pyrinomonadaceae bacterium]|nr:polymer-forming cytoskeletal protein [Pyrinomonadaceae bacterium]
MRITPALTVNDLVLDNRSDQRLLQVVCRASGLLLLLLSMFVVINAQVAASSPAEDPYLVEGVSDTMAYGLGRSIKITGTVKNGAIALGGDVIIQGTVEGDVAAIGGSVIQLEGSRIGGDVIVIGGAYKPDSQAPNRSSSSKPIVYAGYEQELRHMMRNPTEMVAPQWSAKYVGFRILAVLFWFVVSLAITAAMPETISQGVTRLQLTNVRVALIGFFGAAIVGAGGLFGLHYLPTPLSALVGLIAFFFVLLVWLFGRVVTAAATGRWLQRKFLPIGRNSESVALLLGTTFWIALSSVPYIWPFVFAVMVVIGIGLALTARYRIGWSRSQPSYNSPRP